MSEPDRRRLVVAEGDGELDERLSRELVAGLSGWTWGTCAGIGMVWVHEDCRMQGLGQQMLEAAETVARERGCHQILVSSFTLQAPAFYERNGYREFARSEGLPVQGATSTSSSSLVRGQVHR